jgi:hypothetical protein
LLAGPAGGGAAARAPHVAIAWHALLNRDAHGAGSAALQWQRTMSQVHAATSRSLVCRLWKYIPSTCCDELDHCPATFSRIRDDLFEHYSGDAELTCAVPPPIGAAAAPSRVEPLVATDACEAADGLTRAPGGGRLARPPGSELDAAECRPPKAPPAEVPTVAVDSGVGSSGGELWMCSHSAWQYTEVLHIITRFWPRQSTENVVAKQPVAANHLSPLLKMHAEVTARDQAQCDVDLGARGSIEASKTASERVRKDRKRAP